MRLNQDPDEIIAVVEPVPDKWLSEVKEQVLSSARARLVQQKPSADEPISQKTKDMVKREVERAGSRDNLASNLYMKPVNGPVLLAIAGRCPANAAICLAKENDLAEPDSGLDRDQQPEADDGVFCY